MLIHRPHLNAPAQNPPRSTTAPALQRPRKKQSTNAEKTPPPARLLILQRRPIAFHPSILPPPALIPFVICHCLFVICYCISSALFIPLPTLARPPTVGHLA